VKIKVVVVALVVSVADAVAPSVLSCVAHPKQPTAKAATNPKRNILLMRPSLLLCITHPFPPNPQAPLVCEGGDRLGRSGGAKKGVTASGGRGEPNKPYPFHLFSSLTSRCSLSASWRESSASFFICAASSR